MKAVNDQHGYKAGDVLIQRLADSLVRVGLDAYHNQGDEFLCKGNSFSDMNHKLAQAQKILQEPFVVRSVDDRITSIVGADFCFGIGINLKDAEQSLKHQKELTKTLRQQNS